MNKRVCDRCGKEIKEYAGCLSSVFDTFNTHLYLKKLGPATNEDFDLCDECEADLSKWLLNKEEKRECKCGDNKNVVELLDLIDSHEKKICEQSGKIEQLEKENEMLKNSTVKELLESMDIEVSVSIKKKEE